MPTSRDDEAVRVVYAPELKAAKPKAPKGPSAADLAEQEAQRAAADPKYATNPTARAAGNAIAAIRQTPQGTPARQAAAKLAWVTRRGGTPAAKKKGKGKGKGGAAKKGSGKATSAAAAAAARLAQQQAAQRHQQIMADSATEARIRQGDTNARTQHERFLAQRADAARKAVDDASKRAGDNIIAASQHAAAASAQAAAVEQARQKQDRQAQIARMSVPPPSTVPGQGSSARFTALSRVISLESATPDEWSDWATEGVLLGSIDPAKAEAQLPEGARAAFRKRLDSIPEPSEDSFNSLAEKVGSGKGTHSETVEAYAQGMHLGKFEATQVPPAMAQEISNRLDAINRLAALKNTTTKSLDEKVDRSAAAKLAWETRRHGGGVHPKVGDAPAVADAVDHSSHPLAGQAETLGVSKAKAALIAKTLDDIGHEYGHEITHLTFTTADEHAGGEVLAQSRGVGQIGLNPSAVNRMTPAVIVRAMHHEYGHQIDTAIGRQGQAAVTQGWVAAKRAGWKSGDKPPSRIADHLTNKSELTAETFASYQNDGARRPAWVVAFGDAVKASLGSESKSYDFAGFVARLEAKAGGADQNRGNAETLRRYWTHGEGAAKIGWGTKDDWYRCVAELSKYMGTRAKGYCTLRHKEVLGVYPGQEGGGKKVLDTPVVFRYARKSRLQSKAISAAAASERSRRAWLKRQRRIAGASDAALMGRQHRMQDLIKSREWGTGGPHDSTVQNTERSGMWTRERARVHRQLVNEVLNDAVARGVPSDRKAVFLGGLGGAGKSSILRDKDKAEAAGIVLGPDGDPDRPSSHVVINSDLFKEKMIERGLVDQIPGMSPMESAHLAHEESSYLADMALAAASRRGMNVIYDGTMGSENGIRRRVDMLPGYDKTGIFVDVDQAKSKASSDRRYINGIRRWAEGKGIGGRPVPTDFINSTKPVNPVMVPTFDGEVPARSNNRIAFQHLVDNGDIHHAFVYDNQGSGPDDYPGRLTWQK